jgi:hypothetical protein
VTRKLLILTCALAVLAFAPAAHAGCLASGGSTAFDSSKNSWIGHGAIQCTFNNGSDYELRIYLQTNETGSWSISTTSARTVYHKVGGLDDGYQSNRIIEWPCSQANAVSPPFTALRTKVVVENLNTGSIDVDYGALTYKGTACHGQA